MEKSEILNTLLQFQPLSFLSCLKYTHIIRINCENSIFKHLQTFKVMRYLYYELEISDANETFANKSVMLIDHDTRTE